MNRRFYTLLLTCLVITLFSGAIRGRMDQRWGPTPEMLAAAERVAAIPTALGPWKAVTRDHLNADAADMLRCAGNIFRVYVHQPTGKQVTVVFMVGPSGPLVMHTPDACYRSGNYSQHQSRAKKQIIDRQGQPHEFLVTTFQENAAGNRLLRVYYSWNRSREWKAPLAARTAFAGVPMLYKIQVATHDIADIDAGEMFLRDALPELRTVCSPTDRGQRQFDADCREYKHDARASVSERNPLTRLRFVLVGRAKVALSD